MKGSYFQLFLKGCSFSVVALGCMGVLNYLIRRYQVFHLSEYEYGLFYSILALVSLTGSFAEFGLTQAGTVLIAEASLQPERKERLSSCFSGLLGFKFTTSMVLFLILLVFNVPIREHYLKGVPFLFYLTGIALLLAQMADSAFKALWNGTKNYFLQNAISIVQAALLFGLVLIQMMLPSQIFIIPQYQMLAKMGATNSIFALVFPGLVSAFGTFFLRQAYLGIPNEIAEAAYLDGCNKWQTFVKVMLPLTGPSMAALAIFTAVFAYADLMWPLICNTDLNMMTLSAGLSTLNGQYTTNFPVLMAGSLLAMIPMVILYLIFQKQFIQGIAMTGGK